MSSGPTIQTFVSKKKETSTLTFEQMSDPSNYTKKKQAAPISVVLSGVEEPVQKDSKEVSRSKIKPRIKGLGYIGPLENPDDYTEIPKPVPLVQNAQPIKLKTYNGRSK